MFIGKVASVLLIRSTQRKTALICNAVSALTLKPRPARNELHTEVLAGAADALNSQVFPNNFIFTASPFSVQV